MAGRQLKAEFGGVGVVVDQLTEDLERQSDTRPPPAAGRPVRREQVAEVVVPSARSLRTLVMARLSSASFW